MTHTTLETQGNLEASTAHSPREKTGGANVLLSYFWGLVDAAQFTFTILSILVGLAFVISLIL